MYAIWRTLILLVTLLVDNFLTEENYIKIFNEHETKEEGSCVTISCTYQTKEQYSSIVLLWLKDAVWNEELKRFNATTVYNSTDYPLEYTGRVKFSKEKDSCTLNITDLQKNDSGAYSFRFEYKRVDSDSEPVKFISTSNMSLTVKDNPCKIQLNSSGRVKEGDTVILHCLTAGSCAPKWDAPSTYTITNTSTSSELKFNVSWKDNGRTLSCRPAKSNDTCLVRNVTLTVEYAPKDTKVCEGCEKDVRNVREGESVNILCSSKAIPHANLTWFKVNQSQPLQNSEDFYLDKAERTHSGAYYCQATNRHGKQNSSTITINVTYAPKGVRVQFEPTDVQVGDRLTLKCLVEDSNPGVMSGSFIWHKDDEKLAEQNNIVIIQHVSKKDKGLYHCQAKNDMGSTASNKIEVFVKYRPEDTNISGINTVKLQQSLKLTCLTDANPDPNDYVWFHKLNHGKYYAELPYTLKEYWIEKVTIQDSGGYMCNPRNAIGVGSNSTEFIVHVEYAPRLPTLTMPTVIKESELLKIGCAVESYPEAITKLIFTYAQSKSVEKFRVKSNILKFSVNASESSSGLYTCTAENKEGSNSTSKHLKVLYGPKRVQVLVQPGLIGGIQEGYRLLLTCEAHSEPSVSSYVWHKSAGSHRETVGLENTLTINSLSTLDSGYYICVARNDIGSNQSAPVHIRVKYRPVVKIIHNMTSTWNQSLPVYLMCNAQCDPPATSYAWYRLEDNTTALSTTQNYTVQPQSPGRYYCSATNDIGSRSSESIKLIFDNPLLKYFQILIPLLILCITIAGIFLLYRFYMKKRDSEQDENSSFFFSETLAQSSIIDNSSTQENLTMEQELVPCRLRDNETRATTHQHNTPSRENPGTSHIVYDVLKMPQTIQRGFGSTEDIPTTSTLNYVTLKFKNTSDPHKSIPSTDCQKTLYAVVSKPKQNAKNVQGENGDYENIFSTDAKKPAVTNMNWDSDTSEEEEEDMVHFSTVAFAGAPRGRPEQRTPKTAQDNSSSDEEKTNYSQVKCS